MLISINKTGSIFQDILEEMFSNLINTQEWIGVIVLLPFDGITFMETGYFRILACFTVITIMVLATGTVKRINTTGNQL